MKVIYTGFAKCGTKSMTAALRELGFTVYDFMENFELLGDEWTKICKYGGTTEDFRKMFENVDAVTDTPCYMFWEELLEAFPEAKIIHCERPSDEWFVSFHRQMVSEDIFLHKLVSRLSPTWWRLYLYRYSQLMMAVVKGSGMQEELFKSTHLNELICKKVYRYHNSYLKKNAPEHKLLIWRFRDGWQPICQFLNVPIPDKPFPHHNKKASFWKDVANINKTAISIRYETLIGLFAITSLSAYGAYKIHQGPGWMCVFGLPKLAIDSIQGWVVGMHTRN